MGLIFFIGLNGLLVAAVLGVLKKPDSLKAAVREWRIRPFFNLFTYVWVTSILVAGWGVLTDGWLSWPVLTPWGPVDSWKLAGIAAFTGLGLFFAFSAYDNHLHSKRLEGEQRNDG